jgi:hypothetical protein
MGTEAEKRNEAGASAPEGAEVLIKTGKPSSIGLLSVFIPGPSVVSNCIVLGKLISPAFSVVPNKPRILGDRKKDRRMVL